jgi:hypothetical protein
MRRGVASGYGAPIVQADCLKALYAPLRHRQRQKADMRAYSRYLRSG